MKTNFLARRPIYVLIISLMLLAVSFLIFQTSTFQFSFESSSRQISAIIVPHHDLPAVQRQALLDQAAEKITPKTIILVSPNHFNTGGYDIITTDKTWRLTNAIMEPDKTRIAKLKLPNIEAAFEREHGITNLLDPLKRSFPDAKIIPIIIKPDVTPERTKELAESLKKVCGQQCLLVASVDFSHYQPGSLAEIHDVLSQKVLNNLDENLVWSAEVDSRQALALAISWAKTYHTEKFFTYLNTNSGKISNAPDAESTSYILGWFEPGKIIPNVRETFIAGTDLKKVSDPRFMAGVDQVINLSDVNAMARLCLAKKEYCGLNQILWNAPFYRASQNGLVVAGEIFADHYRLVLLSTDNQGKFLRGEDKLKVINNIRQVLNQPVVSIGYGYDIVNIDINAEI